MSLKKFHIFFILTSILLCIAFGFWGYQDYRLNANTANFILGIFSWIGALALCVYLFKTLQRFKNLSL